MEDVAKLLKQNGFEGEIDLRPETLATYSHDASMFEIVPQMVVFPKDSDDVKTLVWTVKSQKMKYKNHISITARSAGTCMSGGAINQSIIMDMNRHFTNIYKITPKVGHAQPGVFYRDFEKATLKQGSLMPSYPASREICTIGGMVANNSGGEKSLEYGKTERFVKELKVIFNDGNEYTVKPLNETGLKAKMKQKDYEGQIYRQVFALVDKNYDEIKAAKPKVSKDSTAYHLWNIWDREKGVFDLTQAIVGSQGTLGFITDIKFRLVPHRPHSGTLVVFLRKTDNLGELIKQVVLYKPSAFEGFDNYTLMLSFKLFPYFRKTLGWKGIIKLGWQLIPEVFKLFRGIPKMILLIEFDGKTKAEISHKIKSLHQVLETYGHEALFEEDDSEAKAKKFWIMRRESFNLLRKKVKDKHAAPFIDDLVVPPERLQEFLPQLRSIIDSYKLLATVAGHMGDGNFHVIPLMKIEEKLERIKLAPAAREVNDLVLKYGGSLSGEHNDGLIRGPWLHLMYSKSMMKHFKDLKQIFDPDNIFNPDKKTDAHWEFSVSHIREKF